MLMFLKIFGITLCVLVAAFMLLFAYSCCVVAKRADEQSEKMHEQIESICN